MSGIIEIENLSFGYTPDSTILKDISFVVQPGTFLTIAGPNGIGKSTLLNLISGTLKPNSGNIRIDKISVKSYRPKDLAAKAAIVRQESIPVFGFSVFETVLMARIPYYGSAGFEKAEDIRIAHDAMQATDTAQFAHRMIMNLSGGERQRVYIARALAQNSPILLLDEPTSFLDFKHQVGIYDLLKTAQLEKDKTIIAVTHDINLAAQYSDKILLLGPGGFCRYGDTKDIFSPELIKLVFETDVFAGEIGQERFFMPLGKLAKDIQQIHNSSTNSQS